jgi:hypothetical protein
MADVLTAAAVRDEPGFRVRRTDDIVRSAA